MEIGTIRKLSATGLVASLLLGVMPAWAHGRHHGHGHWPKHHHGHRPEVVVMPAPIAYVPRPTYYYVLPPAYSPRPAYYYGPPPVAYPYAAGVQEHRRQPPYRQGFGPRHH